MQASITPKIAPEAPIVRLLCEKKQSVAIRLRGK
jgi:hypothetical protein